MTNEYEVTTLDPDLIRFLSRKISAYMLLENVLHKEENWVAGGFARLAAHIHFNLNPDSKTNKDADEVVDDFFKEKSDVDFFSTNDFSDSNYFNESTCILSFSHERFKKCANQSPINAHGRFTIGIADNCSDIALYKSQYSINLTDYSAENISRNKKNRRMREGPFADLFSISRKIQFITSYRYKSYLDCLESFDIVNSKYLIFKEKDRYCLMYSKKALEADSEENLRISRCNSPFLLGRIIKYHQNKKLQIDMTPEEKEIFCNFIYKYNAGLWEKMYDIYSTDSFFRNKFTIFEKKFGIDPTILILLIGKFKTKVMSGTDPITGYGKWKNVDWASERIISKSSV